MIAERIDDFDVLEANASIFMDILTIDSDDKYEEVLEYTEDLLHKVNAGNKNLESLLIRVTDIVVAYEEEHYPLPTLSPVRYLKVLMEKHGHKQCDLGDVAVPSTISAILTGKRKLNLHHIKALAKKYNVPAQYFIDETV